jgi:hypothetical protein
MLAALEEKWSVFFEEYGHSELLPPDARFVYAALLVNRNRERGLLALQQCPVPPSGISQTTLNCTLYTTKVFYSYGDAAQAELFGKQALDMAIDLGVPSSIGIAAATYAACVLLEKAELDAAEHILLHHCFTLHQGMLEHAVLNWAWVAYARGDYGECIDRIRTYPPADSYKWTEQARDALEGLSHAELGHFHAAFELADRVEVELRKETCAIGELSLPVLLISRAAYLRRQERKVIRLVESLSQRYECRDYCCGQRIRIANAETKFRTNPVYALEQLTTVAAECGERGFVLIQKLAERTARRLKRTPLTTAPGLQRSELTH